MIKKFLKAMINMIFPPVCGVCGKIDNKGICNKCLLKLMTLAENRIMDQWETEKNFHQLIYIFKYEGMIRKIILDYKFNEKSYIYETFVNFILKDEKIFKKLQTYDTIIPVPISKTRMKERGYNQSFLIAKALGNKLNIHIEKNCLVKTKNVIEQSKLNREERKQNIQNVYELKNKQILNNRKILLIDDIYTTGNTINECSKILKQANPKGIDVLVLAKD